MKSRLALDGQEEHPLPFLTRSDAFGFKQDRSRHDVPKPSQIRDNPFGQVLQDSGDVFKEEDSGLIELDGGAGCGPQVPLVVGALPLAGD